MYYLEGQVPAQEMLRAQDLNHRKKWTLLKKHRCPATHPEHDPPSDTIGHLVKTHFKHSLRSNNQPACKLQWLYATIARHSYLGTVEYHVLHWFMPVSEGQMWRIFLVGGWATHLHESIGITFLGLQCCKNTLKPATRSSLLVYPWCTQ